MVLTPEGPRFTRAGTLRLNEGACSSTATATSRRSRPTSPNPNTHVIMEGGEPGITTTTRMNMAGDYNIALDGQVFRGTEALYKLVVVKFDKPELLVKTGDNYYPTWANSHLRPQPARPGRPGRAT
jgi:flagellar basal body rod protein FlgG